MELALQPRRGSACVGARDALRECGLVAWRSIVDWAAGQEASASGGKPRGAKFYVTLGIFCVIFYMFVLV